MADSITTCAANLVAILTAAVALMANPLPIFPDTNIQTGDDAPPDGYIQVWPLRARERQISSAGNRTALFGGPFTWSLSIYIKRGAGEGGGSSMAEAIVALYRSRVIGDLTVESADFDPIEKQPADPFFQYDVRVAGEKLSYQTIAA